MELIIGRCHVLLEFWIFVNYFLPSFFSNLYDYHAGMNNSTRSFNNGAKASEDINW